MVQRLSLPRPVGGLYTELPPDEIPANKLSRNRNFRTYTGEMRFRDGYGQKGATLDTAVMALDEYALESGTTYLVAITQAKLERWNPAGPAWVNITGPAFTGDDDRPVATEIIQDVFIWSDGDYGPMRWTGTGAYTAVGGTSVPFVAAANFADRVVVGRTKEGGAVKPLRIRWPISGDYTDWGGIGSGFVDLRDTVDWVQGLAVLTDDLVIYKERSIWVGRETGKATPAIEFDSHLLGTGLLFSRGIGDLGDEHLFVAPDAIYLFRWSNIESIDGDIHTEFYNMLNMEFLDRCFSTIVEEFSEWHIFIVRTGQTFPDFVWVYNYFDKTWDNYELGHTVSTPGYTSRAAGLTFDELTGTMDEQAWRGDDRTIAYGFPLNLLGSDSGKVYEIDPNADKDDGLTIQAEAQSKDFYSEDPSNEVTITRLVVMYRYQGTLAVLTIGISVDGGVTWAEQNVTVTPGGSLEIKEVHADIIKSGLKFRFRVKTTDPVRIIGFRPWVSGRGLRID
jgi:hypothetical protein